jgi:hypothetical protein
MSLTTLTQLCFLLALEVRILQNIQIQQRADADPMDGNELDIGAEEEEEEVVDEENNNNNIDEEAGEAPEDDQTPRRLFAVAAPRPLVRTPVSVGRSRQTGNSDLATAVFAHLNQSQTNERIDREERDEQRRRGREEQREEQRRRERLDQEDRRMNQLFMIGLLTAINPGAAAAMQPIQHRCFEIWQIIMITTTTTTTIVMITTTTTSTTNRQLNPLLDYYFFC